MLSRPAEVEPPATLRSAMRQLAGGVSIITTGSGENRAGFTASSVTSLTLEPPCILVCVNRKVSAWPTIRREGRFCANILGDRHRGLALRFSGAGGIRGIARFDEGRWIEGANGTPVLADALAGVECDLQEALERDSHVIAIGAVRQIRLGGTGTPLVYAQGGYATIESYEGRAPSIEPTP